MMVKAHMKETTPMTVEAEESMETLSTRSTMPRESATMP
jgi:hypothetical protein